MVQNQSHGRAHADDVAKAAAIDLVTLPVQIVAVPALAISGHRSKASQTAAAERDRIRWEQAKLVMARLDVRPEICIEEDFLSQAADSIDNFALNRFLVENRGRQFSDEFYYYVFWNSRNREHENTGVKLMRNIHLPMPILIQAYDYYVVSMPTHQYPYPESYNYLTVLEHPKLPEHLLTAALDHPYKVVREKTARVIEHKTRQAAQE